MAMLSFTLLATESPLMKPLLGPERIVDTDALVLSAQNWLLFVTLNSTRRGFAASGLAEISSTRSGSSAADAI